ncbi:MAG: class I SAM-dependent methyltransferase [Gluconacetobacter diazotrophicus]|nr:class I SAM-dependent methyltransferase [Gluconacetobacter diazotrophicus]
MRFRPMLACLPLLLAGALPASAKPMTLDEAVAAPWRTAKFVARDGARHPAAELGFFGITPRSNVVEIWPGGGYWTQILAPFLHDQGSYTLAMGVPGSTDEAEAGFALKPKFRAMLDADPALYGRIKLTEFGHGHDELAPPESADLVLTFRNLHNWMGADDAPELLAAIFRALKPGGVLGIEDHRGNTKTAQDPKADSGYVRQDYAIALIEKAGFQFVGSSEMDANPKDTADWPKGVWTLPPTLALGATDRAKYQAIGEADNFVLKFRKPGG